MKSPITQAGQAAANRIKEFRQNVNNGATAQQARATVRALEKPTKANQTRANELNAGNPNFVQFGGQSTTSQQTPKATVKPTVSANDLANPAPQVTLPEPKQGTSTLQSPGLVGSVAEQTQQFIQSESENAKRRDEIAGLLGSQEFDGAGERERLNTEFGVTGNLSRLQDIQTQLAQANTQSALTQTRIEGAAGQTIGQAGREVTQEQRENAVRNAGIAAEAAVLQGNIETASTLINQAMTDYYADRELKNENMIQQLDYFSGLADNETAQLLQKEQRKYEEDQEKIKYVKDSVNMALQAGASPAEISQLTSPDLTEDQKLSLAQKIVGSRAYESVQSELAYKRIRNATASMEYNKALNALQGGDPGLTEEQRKKIGDMPESKKAQSLITLNNNLTKLKNAYETYGSWNPFDREAANKISSLRGQLEIAVAVAGGQGAIGEKEGERYADILGGKFFQTGGGAATAIESAITTNDQAINDNINYVSSSLNGAATFEPFQGYLKQKEADAYIDQKLTEVNDPVDSYLQNLNK